MKEQSTQIHCNGVW